MIKNIFIGSYKDYRIYLARNDLSKKEVYHLDTDYGLEAVEKLNFIFNKMLNDFDSLQSNEIIYVTFLFSNSNFLFLAKILGQYFSSINKNENVKVIIKYKYDFN